MTKEQLINKSIDFNIKAIARLEMIELTSNPERAKSLLDTAKEFGNIAKVYADLAKLK